MGGGWRTKGGVLSHCVLTEVDKHPQFTCQASMVADIKCSLTSVPQRHIRTALHSGLSGIYWVTEMMPVKADLAICSSANGVSG